MAFVDKPVTISVTKAIYSPLHQCRLTTKVAELALKQAVDQENVLSELINYLRVAWAADGAAA